MGRRTTLTGLAEMSATSSSAERVIRQVFMVIDEIRENSNSEIEVPKFVHST